MFVRVCGCGCVVGGCVSVSGWVSVCGVCVWWVWVGGECGCVVGVGVSGWVGVCVSLCFCVCLPSQNKLDTLHSHTYICTVCA